MDGSVAQDDMRLLYLYLVVCTESCYLYWAMLRSASRGGAQWARVQAALREQAALSRQVVMRKHDLRRACASVAAAANAAANAQCSLADAFLCSVPRVSRFAQYAE